MFPQFSGIHYIPVNNGLGELVLQTSAEGDKTCIAYDLLGRMVLRVDQYGGDLAEARNDCDNADGTDPITTPVFSHWEYDHLEEIAEEEFSYGGVGKLYRTYSGSDYSSSTEYREERLYDTSGRLTDVSKTIKTEDYHYETSYDAYSRPEELTYPYPQGDTTEPLVVKHEYNGLGFLTEIRNADNNDLFYEVVDMNERGQIIEENFGNGVVSLRAYDNAGRADTIYTYGLSDIQDIDVDFDLIGNLTARADAVQGYTETFDYDDLNRLTDASADFGNSDVRVLEVEYDVLGNILTKEQTGTGSHNYTYTYGGSKPHAVTAISGSKSASYTYDDNGNMLTGDGRTITYATFDLPTVITKGSTTSTIAYGPDRNRYWREDVVTGSPNQVTTTIQVDGLYEKVTLPNSTVEEKHYLGNFAVITFTGRTASAAGSSTTRYLHTDHLGSLTAVTDESGDLVELHNYDSWGQRRSLNATTLTALLGGTLWGNLSGLQLVSGATTKGYTGHENFDGVGIIHMNGRIYDPLLARFMQADPIIQDTTDLQAFNRYSYVQNRPLSLTDPSGFMSLGDAFDKIKDVYKVIDPVGYAVMKAQAKAHQALARETGRLFIKVPELQAVAVAVATYFTGPLGAAAVNGMITSSITYQSGGSLSDILTDGAVAFSATYVVMQGAQMAGNAGGAYANSLGTACTIGKEAFGRAIGSMAAGLTMGGAISKAQGGRFFDSSTFVNSMAMSVATQWVLKSFSSSASAQSDMAEGGGGTGGGSGGGVGKNGNATAYIGGAMDSTTGIVMDSVPAGGQYFEWTQGDELTQWIDANQDKNISILAHSYGGDTAAEVVAQGHYVDNLITVDPVGWTRPNFNLVAKFSGTWTNYDSSGAGFSWGNFVATIGRAYNSAPSAYATTHYALPYSHVGIWYKATGN